jgi:purine-binding chemotaxis protein CheW
MSPTGPHLVFEASEGRYGVGTDHVRRVLWLPVLGEATARCRGQVGQATLEDEAVAVLDADLALSAREPDPYTMEHRLLDLAVDGERLGLVVADVLDVVDVAGTDLVDEAPDQEAIAAAADTELGRIELVDLAALATATPSAEDPAVTAADLFATFDAEEREQLARRRERLTLPGAGQARADRRGVVVGRIGETRVAVPLDEIRGFLRIGELTPVPHTPEHVLGLVNHRGEIVTTVDPTGPLELPAQGARSPQRAAVVDRPAGPTGLAFDRVGWTLAVEPDEVDEAEPRGLAGTIDLDGERVPVLDVPALLRSPRVLVDQEA